MMKMHSRLRKLLSIIGFFCLLWTTVSIASKCEIPTVTKDNVINLLDDIVSDECLGVSACSSALCKTVSNWEKKWDGKEPQSDMVQEAAPIMESVRQMALNLDEKIMGVKKFRTLTQKWIDAMSSGNMLGVTSKYFQPYHFRIQFNDDDIMELDVRLKDYCTKTLKQCQQAFQVYTDMYTGLIIEARIKKVLEKKSWRAAADYIERLDQRWKAFIQDGRAMYPTDMLANSIFYRDRWSQSGFIEPPSRQILFLHPDVAFQINKSDDNKYDDKLEEGLVLELLGAYWWTWGGKNKAEVTKPHGVALAVSWTGREKVSYGFMAHMPRNWSLGVMTNDDGDLSVLLSADLGKLFLSGKNLRNEFKEKLLK